MKNKIAVLNINSMNQLSL